jgi:MAP/microtubule affinity-regulating kinase
MNINHENEELRPYEEPSQDFCDNYRIGIFEFIQKKSKILFILFYFLEAILRDANYTRDQILDSLTSRNYDDIMAFYLLLGLRTIEVKQNYPFLFI